MDDGPRKRSRTGGAVTPPRISGGTAANTAVRLVESSDDRVRASQLRDPKQRVKALNALLKLSSSHEANYALTGDSIMISLSNIALEIMDWDMPPPCQRNNQKSKVDDDENQDLNSADKGQDGAVFSASSAWITPPTKEMRQWSAHWKEEFGTIKRCTKDPANFKMLEVIVAILRNFSFVGANLRLIAYSPVCVALLVGCMYEVHDDYGSAAAANDIRSLSAAQQRGHVETASDESAKTAMSRINITVNAIQTLIHLGPLLDFSGQKLLADRLFYSPATAKDGPIVPNLQSFGQTVGGKWGWGGMWLGKRLDTKEDVMSDVSKEFILSFTSDYLESIWSIFPALCHLLTNQRCPRQVMLAGVDLLQELINHARVGVVGSVDLEDKQDEIPSIRKILVNMPDEVLERLVDLLYIPRLGPDSLEYLDPIHNVVARVTTLRLLGGYDATVDTDLRDRGLDVLVPLLELDSPRMAGRLGMHKGGKMPRTRLWDALLPILTTSAGRNDATVLAAQLLRELGKSLENKPGLLYVQSRLVELASRDHRIAYLVWNHLYPAGGEDNVDVDGAADAEDEGVEDTD